MGYEDLVYDGYYVSEVLYQLQSGKEATVFCCRAQEHTGLEYVAVKVYRALQSRGFRNDAIYQRGRYIKDARLRRAYRSKTAAGRRVQFSNWVTAEYETMRLLHLAGARIPEPYALSGQSLIMEYFGDLATPAPSLNRVHLSKPEAAKLYHDLIGNVGLWLACGRVHADLSPFNVLYWRGDFRVIDFPQSVNPLENQDAFQLLLRDIENICHYFSKYGISDSPYDIAFRLWCEYTDINV